ncbi:MAG: hypothetical protein A2288_02285 [Candidatus Moranbacteria bacterium RIFOXYA12_FULL_44_15]|nr:MAG: hypothetical protein A2288_02285 [Candidatus Moranbacteria bacterium RIFOXYA12_FULL_44_15]OGI36416.1 MAG: hypothetical protein A2259_03395 [Candidatus Moranbacteria bacterium RIFOXYA2_FULL_43_15]
MEKFEKIDNGNSQEIYSFDEEFKTALKKVFEWLKIELSNIEKMRLKEIVKSHIEYAKKDVSKMKHEGFGGHNPGVSAAVAFMRDYYELDLTDPAQEDIVNYVDLVDLRKNKKDSLKDYFKDKQKDSHLP